ncbi:MAG: hypothetical protein E6J09_10550 [Chloroflexi bacterium]|nr:MAG: hypothetical protein E6J09_10550 [Chloroflexota bacterium]
MPPTLTPPTLAPTPTLPQIPTLLPTPTLSPALPVPPTPTLALVPTPTPTFASIAPAPVGNSCNAPVNPWGYNFCVGSLIWAPEVAFCTYFTCIPNFADGKGFVIQCADGMFSRTGSIAGSCAGHGGNRRALFFIGDD